MCINRHQLAAGRDMIIMVNPYASCALLALLLFYIVLFNIHYLSLYKISLPK